jgi:hypothetical protein
MTEQHAGPTTERTYIGRRNDDKGAVVYAYLDSDGKERWAKKALHRAAVGSVITLTYTDDTSTSYWSGGEHGPKVTSLADVSEETLLKWQALDAAAYQVKAQADAMTRTIKESSHLDHHIDALATAARAMSPTQRAAFARWVAERIR